MILEPPEVFHRKNSRVGSVSFANPTQTSSGYFVFLSLLETLLISRGCVRRPASKPEFTAISAPPQHRRLIVSLRGAARAIGVSSSEDN